MQHAMAVTAVTAKDISEEMWVKLTDLTNEVEKVSDPQDPRNTVENIKARYRTVPEHLHFKMLLATERGKEGPAGIAHLLFDEGALADATFVRMFVPPSSSQSSVHDALAEKIQEAAAASGRSLIMFETMSTLPATEEFLSRIGAEKRQEQKEVRLFIKDIDWNMVSEWSKTIPSDFSLEVYHSPIPEEKVPEIIELIDTGMNLMPIDDLEVQISHTTKEKCRAIEASAHKSGGLIYTVVTRHISGEAAGLTIISYKPDVLPHMLLQLMTVVKPKFRGNGLGKLMKARMLEHIRGRHPQALWISTDNAATNASMRRINEELGFRLYKTVNYWQMPVARLTAYLENG